MLIPRDNLVYERKISKSSSFSNPTHKHAAEFPIVWPKVISWNN